MRAMLRPLEQAEQAAPDSPAAPVTPVTPVTRTAEFFFGPDFAGFDGHFPGDPILPGIVQIMAVALTARPGYAGGPAKLLQVGRTKFTGFVRPGETLRVRAVLSDHADGVRVSGECSTANGVCAQIKIVLDR